MSLIYTGLYFVTNILAPISFMISLELRFFTSNENQKYLSKQVKRGNEEHNSSGNYGKWVMLIFSIFLFNFLFTLFPKSLIVIFLGLIVKSAILKSPYVLVQFFQLKNHALEEKIQKFHLEVFLEIVKLKAIDIYFDLTEKLNFFIIFQETEQKDERFEMLHRIKDSVSRIQLELEDNEQIKNKSFIVAVKKMQTIKSIKSFQNIGINCDILKGSEVGRQLLKILQEKTLAKERSQASRSKNEQPTKDKLQQSKKVKQPTTQEPRSQSLQQKMRKMKYRSNVPTSEKKILKQLNDDESHFTIKRSQTLDIDELQFQDSPSRKRGNNHIPVYIKSPETASFRKNTQSVGYTYQDQSLKVNDTKILPPFKVKLSSLMNPLIITGQQPKRKILPAILQRANYGSILLADHLEVSLSSTIDPAQKKHLTTASHSQLKTMLQQFGEQPPIPKVQMSINESDYSDMFESQGQEKQPNLQIKVEAVVESQGLTKGLKPKLDICYIQLYDNKEIKFFSVSDKVTFQGKILKMLKSTENYFYDLVCEEYRRKNDKQTSPGDENVEVIKKVKFRGQAKPFMKYLEKLQP